MTTKTVSFKYVMKNQEGKIFTKVFEFADIFNGFAQHYIQESEYVVIAKLQVLDIVDHNKKPIYEGDIMRVELGEDHEDERHHCVLTWIKEWSMWAWLLIEHGEYEKYLAKGAEELDTTMYWCYPAESIDRENIQIRGNVFEHPNLIATIMQEHSI